MFHYFFFLMQGLVGDIFHISGGGSWEVVVVVVQGGGSSIECFPCIIFILCILSKFSNLIYISWLN